MIRILYLRFLAHCYARQESGLRAELAGVEYMLMRNAEDQRRIAGELAVAESERRLRRYRVLT